MPSPTLGELHRRTVATAPTTAAESTPLPTLASLCGYVEPIPPSVGIAAEGLTLTPQLITSLKQSPGRNIQVGEIVHHDCRRKGWSSKQGECRRKVLKIGYRNHDLIYLFFSSRVGHTQLNPLFLLHRID